MICGARSPLLASSFRWSQFWLLLHPHQPLYHWHLSLPLPTSTALHLAPIAASLLSLHLFQSWLCILHHRNQLLTNTFYYHTRTIYSIRIVYLSLFWTTIASCALFTLSLLLRPEFIAHIHTHSWSQREDAHPLENMSAMEGCLEPPEDFRPLDRGVFPPPPFLTEHVSTSSSPALFLHTRTHGVYLESRFEDQRLTPSPPSRPPSPRTLLPA